MKDGDTQEALEVFTGIAKLVEQKVSPAWDEMMKILISQTHALETLAAMAKRAQEKEEPWHNTTDDLANCIRNGEAYIDDRPSRVVFVLSFRDPCGNQVMVDYVINNESQKEKAKKLKEKIDKNEISDIAFKDEILKIINEIE